MCVASACPFVSIACVSMCVCPSVYVCLCILHWCARRMRLRRPCRAALAGWWLTGSVRHVRVSVAPSIHSLSSEHAGGGCRDGRHLAIAEAAHTDKTVIAYIAVVSDAGPSCCVSTDE